MTRSWGAERETAAIAPRLSRIGISLPLALGLLCDLAGLLSTKARLADPDIMLHIVTGRWIIAHRAVPHVDFLSHTMAGTRWVAHEWLGEVITALVYDGLGWAGLVAMASLCLGVTVAIFVRALLRYYPPPFAIIIGVAAWFVVLPHWLARPHMIALPFLVLWLALLVEARERSRAPPLAAVLLMIPWVNLHGSFLVGIVFAGLFALEAIAAASGAAARLAALRQWTIFTLLAVMAALVTPNFIEAYLLPLRLMRMTFALSILLEWKSVDFQHVSTLEIWLVLFIGTVLACGIKLPLSRMLMTLLLFVASLQHARNADLLAFMAPLIAAPAAGPQLARVGGAEISGPVARRLDRLAGPATARGLMLAAAIVLLGIAIGTRFPVTPADTYMPVAAVRAVAARGITGPVLNDYDYGDYLVFRGIKTFIDGRADMYGDPFIKRYYDATRGFSSELPALLEEYHIAWTIFPRDSQAVVQLDRLPGWRRFYGDDMAVVHVRDGAPPPDWSP